MGYYWNENYYDELVISDVKSAPSEITIFNNDILSIQLKDVKVPVNSKITNPDVVSIIYINIDWGDGKTDSLNPINNQNTVAITGEMDNNWMNIEHEYHFPTEIKETNLVITVYNSVNDSVTFNIKVKVNYQSLTEMGTRFELITANLTNDNTVSYILHDANTKQMIVVNSYKDEWTEHKKFLSSKTDFGTNL